MKVLFFIILSAGIGFGTFYLFFYAPPLVSPIAETKSSSRPVSENNTVFPSPVPTRVIQLPVIPPGAFSSLRNQIKDIASKSTDYRISVVIKDMNKNENISFNGSQTFFAASTAKLITASYFLHQVEEGNESIEGNLGIYPKTFQLRQLINQSNNISWDHFNTLLGLKQQQEYADSIGVTGLNVMKNEVYPEGIAYLLKRLYNGELLNAEHTKLLLSYMQHTEEERFIPKTIPGELTLYHKGGLYEAFAHDASILSDGKNTIVLVIFTDGGEKQLYDTRAKIFHEITKAVTGTLFRL